MSDIMEEYVGTPAGEKKKSKKQRAPIEYPDSLHSKQYAKFIDLLCEGEIYGLVNQTDPLKSIYLDDIPIMSADGISNYSGITMQERKGTQSQTYMDGFSSIEAEQGVGIQIKAAVPHTIRIDNPNATAVRVTVGIPSMMYQNMTTGDTSGTTVQIALSMQTGGTGGYAPITAGFDTFALTPSGTTGLTSGGQSISGNATVNISWVGEDNGSYGVSQSCSYSLEYRVIGAPSWTVYTTGTFSGYLTQVMEGDAELAFYYSWISTDGLPKGTKSVTIPLYNYSFYWYNAPASTYEFRVVKTSGLGTLSMPSGTAPRLTSALTITGKTTSKYQRSYRIPLSGSPPWDIRVSRITADSTTGSLSNDTWWDSYTEVIESKLSYPNSALIAMTIDAEQLDDIPKRGYDIKGLLIKVPTNYFPGTRTYTRNVSTGSDTGVPQVWDGNFYTTWSDNPAWCFYDLVTADRYGLGKYIPTDLVDKWGLYEIAQYCDQYVEDGFGGTEPRFTCNVYLQTREEAYKVLNTMASIFRGMTYWATGQLVTIQDAPKEPTALFSKANVIDGEFHYEGSSARTRHTVALVSWNDPAENYENKIEYVEDDEGIALYGINQTDVVAVGCTSRGQAHRVGRWMLYTERLESEIITFKAGLDGLVVYPGAIIKTSDPIRSGKRYGGRLISASTSLLVLDAPYTHDGTKTYTINVILPNGSIESRTVTSPGNITTDNIVPTVNFTEAPQSKSMWVLAENTLEAELWRVITIKEVENTQAEITAVAYRADKYAIVENNLQIQDIPISSIRSLPPKPSQGWISDSIYRTGASICTKLLVSWDSVQAAVRYTVRYRLGSENWITLPETKATSLDILNVVDLGVYTVRVYSVNSLGRESSEFLEFTYTVIGKTAPPSNVLVFTPTITRTGVVLEWDDIDDVDRDLFCITDVDTDTNTTPPGVAPTQRYTIAGLTYTLPPQVAGTHDFFIRAIDTTGNYSLVFKSATFTVVVPSTPTVSYVFEGTNIRLSWSDCATDHNIDYYSIQRGGEYFGDSQGVILGNSYTTGFTVPVDWSTSETFWVVARDIAGNYGVADSVIVTVVPATITTPLANYSNNELILSWAPATIGSLPIVKYEIRSGADWATGQTVGFTNDLLLKVPANWTGAKTFWLAATDFVNLYSNYLSVTTTIVIPSAPLNPLLEIANTNCSFYWEPPATGTLNIAYYEVRMGGLWSTGDILGTTNTNSLVFPVNWVNTQTFWVHAVDVSGNIGPTLSDTFNITAPTALTVSSTIIGVKAQLTWNIPTSVLPISYYDIRVGGVSWELATPLTTQAGTDYRISIDWVGSRTFWVNAINVNGTIGTADDVEVNVLAPTSPIVSASVNQDSFDLTWTAPIASLPIVDYVIKHGASWGAGTVVGTSNTNTLTVKGTWLGERFYWVAAVDVNGNEGIPASVSIIITAPAAPNNFRQQTIDNNVLLYWDQVQGTLPTKSYELRSKGSTWATASLIGEKSGGFTTVFETAGGVFTYWIAAIDSAGNYGTPVSLTATVSQPPDYILKDNFNSLLDGTLVNGYKDSFGITIPINSTESYEQHFSRNKIVSPNIFSVSPWGSADVAITANDAIAPDGSTTASKIDDTGAPGWGHINQSITGVSTQSCVAGLFVKKDVVGRATRFPLLRIIATGPTEKYGYIAFDTSTGASSSVAVGAGVVIDGSGVIDYDASYWRVWVAVTITDAAITAYNFQFFPAVGAASDWTQSTAATGYVHAWGAQFVFGTSLPSFWFTPQNQVDASYPIYIQPNLSPGSYTEVIDYGATLASNKITVTQTGSTITGTVTSVCTISVSDTSDTGPWDDYIDVWETYAQNFRYVKVSIVYTATSTTDLMLLTGLNIRLDSKLKTMTQTLPVIANVSGTYSQTGTTVTVTAAGTWVAGRDVSLDSTGVSGTYSQSGTTITVAAAGTWTTGHILSLKFTTGTTPPANGNYTIVSGGSGSFTCTSAVSGSPTGNITIGRVPDNVYEIVTGGSGTFTITSPNSTTTSGNCTVDADGTPFWMTDDGTPTGDPIFLDVDAVQVSALGTVPLIALYNFVDTPNPTVCKVLFFNTAGVRQPGTASVTVRGF